MSTPRWKKEQRQRELMAQAVRRKQERALNSRSAPKRNKDEFKEYVLPDIVRRDDGVEYRSLNSNEYNTFKADDKVYTGTLVKGIGTMHKSNAVPIISQEEAIDIATMRRN
jgi:FKBP-type peptidyl-prolyl cis-trans isomerase